MSEPARCLDCGYVLTGLPSSRCPECGRDFDLILMLAPTAAGILIGYVLRRRLKRSGFDQRSHLPVFLAIVAPLLAGAIEKMVWVPHRLETIGTSMEIPAPVGKTWNSLMFYEEVRHQPPWLLRYALPHPLYTRGSTEHVGDLKVCVYSKGRLIKRVTERVPSNLLVFNVVDQDRIENNSVRLTSGSFRLIEISSSVTRLELQTSYEPKLGPRWIWRPFEKLAVHSLHRFVLEGIRLKAIGAENREHDIRPSE